MLARSIEIGHPYFRSKRRAGKSANGSAQSVGRISRRRNPPTAVPEQPSGGLRFANPPYALLDGERDYAELGGLPSGMA
jgi:hypothetical protein